MSTARRYRNSYSDYLRLEQESPLKLEYADGEIYAMDVSELYQVIDGLA